MAKKRKDKRPTGPEPTKEEKAVATYVRFNCPTKQTTVAGDEVHYFVGRKAVDSLLESKWMLGKCKSGEPLFTNRATAGLYLQTLLEKGMFWRARRLVPRALKEQTKKTDDGKGTPKAARERRPAAGKEKEGKEKDEKKEEKEDDSKKKKKKVKLEFHPDQTFIDGADVYVWHFDPVTWTKFLIGLGLVLASVALCLFPLWPSWTRQAVYYVSLAAMGFVGFLIFLIILRAIVFAVVWLCTRGRLHFWMLPNLTEDCDFFASFVPAYSYEYHGDAADGKADRKGEEEDEDNSDEDEGDGENEKEDERKSDDEDGEREAENSGESNEDDNGDGSSASTGGGDTGADERPQRSTEAACEDEPKLTRRRRARARRDSGGRGFEMVDPADV